jgi:hypothetical protein
VTVTNRYVADTKFESKGAEAKGGGDDLFNVEDFKSEAADEFDQVSCVVVVFDLLQVILCPY